MVRAARLCMFTATAALILVALGYATFAYTAYLGTSPLAKMEMFPRTVLLGIAILAPTVLVTSVTSCSGLYRLSQPHLHVTVVMLVFVACAHAVIASLAYRERSSSTALSAATAQWTAAPVTTRELVETDFACCGWTDMAAVSTGGICMADRACRDVVAAWRVSMAPIVGGLLCAGVGVFVTAAGGVLLLIRSLRLRNVRLMTELKAQRPMKVGRPCPGRA
ncbi:hypothetical protein HKX48_006270 [Thoreauomyces humboldtii]|nr:hypothetical protein HKX48_006270 [Thoreauomyces humboldtii]